MTGVQTCALPISGHGYVVPLLGAAIVPVLIAAVSAARRAATTASLLWSAVGFVVYAVYAALGDTAPNVVPTATTARELTSGLTQGWADLLTMSLPVPVQPYLLVSALGLTWAAAAIGAEFAHRSRSSVAPVLPALLLEVAVLGFAAPRPSASVWPAAALTSAVLVVLLTIVVGSFDGDVLQPLVMGKAVNLHPLAIVFAIAAGSITLGILGALVAVPIAGALYGVAKFVTNRDPEHPYPPPPLPPPAPSAPGRRPRRASSSTAPWRKRCPKARGMATATAWKHRPSRRCGAPWRPRARSV
mgnify:CR=1 FL=1